LSVWALTDELSAAVQIAVPRRSRRPHIDFPPVESFLFDARTFEEGVEPIEAAPGEAVRVYSAARTVVDMMRIRRRLGEAHALAALRTYLGFSPDARPAEVL
jgi:hypothetical protein